MFLGMMFFEYNILNYKINNQTKFALLAEKSYYLIISKPLNKKDFIMRTYFLAIFIFLLAGFSHAQSAKNEEIITLLGQMETEALSLKEASTRQEIETALRSFNKDNMAMLNEFQFSEDFLLKPSENDTLFMEKIMNVQLIVKQDVLQKSQEMAALASAQKSHKNPLEISSWEGFILLRLAHTQYKLLSPAFENFPKDDPTYSIRKGALEDMRLGLSQIFAGITLTQADNLFFTEEILKKDKEEFRDFIPRLIDVYDAQSWQQLIDLNKQNLTNFKPHLTKKAYKDMAQFISKLEKLGKQNF